METTRTKRFLVKENCPCIKINGISDGPWTLFRGLEYDATQLVTENGIVSFSLYDEQGWIADYQVKEEEFNQNCTLMD